MKRRRTIRTKAGLRLIAAAGLALGTLQARAGDAPDLDGDGIPNIVDPDVDNDGIPNALDDNVDGGIARSGPYSGQYIGDHVNNDNPAEKDIDDDDQADDSLGETDIDGDSKTDDSPFEDDIDGDRRDDDSAGEMDIDGDGRLDDEITEDDIDGDGLDDDDTGEEDIDGDSRDDLTDDDIDGDGRGNSGSLDDDTDGDGIPNADDDDSDGDGIGNREDSDDDNDGDSDEDDLDHHHEADEIEVEVALAPTANAPAGSRSRVEVQRMATGKVDLKVDARDLPQGDYDVVVDGVVLGPLEMEGDGDETEGEVRFETDPNDADELPLPFDPIGLPITLQQGDTVFFIGTVPTPPDAPDGGGGGDPDDHGGGDLLTARLDKAAGLPAEASAEVQVQFGIAGVIAFETEVEDLPAGDYDLAVGGIPRATLTVIATESGTRGKLRFDVVPDGAGELVLDFPVAGEPVILSQAGTTLFSGTVPSQP